MIEEHSFRRPTCVIRNSLTLLILLFGVSTTQAERYAKDVMLNGAPVPSEHISGFKGADFEIGVPNSTPNDDYAIFGLTSEERRDNPCYVTIRTENVNNSSDKYVLPEDRN